MQDSFLDVNNNAIAVSEYGEAADGSAAYTSVQMLSCFVLYLIASFYHNSDPLLILGILLGMLIVAYSCAIFFQFKKHEALRRVQPGPGMGKNNKDPLVAAIDF